MSSGPVTPYVDFGGNANDTNENNAASIQPVADGEGVTATVFVRPTENIRKRSEVIRGRQVDSLFLENADRVLIVSGPGKITWPGSTTAGANGIPVLSDVLWILPMLTPGFAQAAPVPPVASAFGVIHLQRATGPSNAIAVTSQRRSYAAGDQINITVTPGGVYSCTLDVEDAGALRRTIKIVATGATTLGTVITSLNALTPPAPDNASALVSAALEGGASSGDLILTTQARQFMSGNYDGEGHAITPANLAAFFSGSPAQALAEGDTLCVAYADLFDTASTGGRRQSIPENANTAVPTASYFNSRVHPESLFNALPICKVVNGSLVFGTGAEIPAGSTNVGLAAESIGANVVRNGGFERATTNATGRYQIADWENLNGVTAAQWRSGTTSPRSGARSLELNKGAGTAASTRVEQGQEIPVTPGQTIHVSVWVKQLIAPTAGTYSVGLYWGDLDSATVTSTLVALQVLSTTDGSYRHVVATVVVPANKRFLKKVTVETAGVTTGSTGVTLLVDDLVVTVEQEPDDASPTDNQHSQLQAVQALRVNAPDAAFGDASALTRYVPAGGSVTTNVAAPDGALAVERADQTYSAGSLPINLAVLGQLLGLGAERLYDAAGARSSRILSPYDTATPVTLMWTMSPKTGVSLPNVRVYATSGGVLQLTFNASFDGTNWNKDQAGVAATMLVMDAGKYQVFHHANGDNAAWATWTKVAEFNGAETVTAANPDFPPMLAVFDSAGNRRVALDHVGAMREQNVLHIHQNWCDPTFSAWSSSVNGTGTNTAVTDPAANKPSVWLAQAVVANADRAVMHLENQRPAKGPWNADMMCVIEWDVDATDLAGTPSLVYQGGLCHDEVTEPSNEDAIKFYKTSGSANWKFQTTASGASNTNTDTTVAATGIQRLRIDMYGANWPGGARAQAFINGVLVAENTTNLPANLPMSLLTYLKSTGATNKTVYVSPMTARFYRRLTDDAV
jgi:hypothetical protein